MAETLDLSQFGGSGGSNPAPSTQLDLSQFGGSGGTKDSSSTPKLDLSAFMGSSPNPSSSPAPSTGWNGPLDNPIGRWTGANAIADFLGGKVDQFEHETGISNINGAYRGFSSPNHPQPVVPSDGTYLGEYAAAGQNIWGGLKNLAQSAYEGFNNPDAATQRYTDTLNKGTQGMDPVSRATLRLMGGAGSDLLSFMPVGSALKGIGTVLKDTSDFAGATPYLAKAADAVANAPYIQPALQGTQDVLGKMFKPNYGASPALVDAINGTRGTQAVNQDAMIRALADMSQGHNLSPDELNQIGHVVEGTVPGTPEQQAFAQQWSDAALHGPQMPEGASPIGTNAMLHTASATDNGAPLLKSTIDNYFSHVYDNASTKDGISFPKSEHGGYGLSPDGTFNMERTYPTLQVAQEKGLKPTLNPFQVLGRQWEQNSNSLTNNSLLQQIKNTPNILFEKDPIDEIQKLYATGRMDGTQAKQAMQELGLTANDMKPGGMIQSQIPQLSGSYIRKADEAALQEHLNPTQPTGFNKVAQGAENLYNKGYLLNPLPHLHNVLVNGSFLGGAKIGDILATKAAIKAGTEPMYQRAMQAGAISNPIVGKFSDAVDRAIAPQGGNIASRTLDAAKGAATNILTQNQSLKSLGSNLTAPLQPLRDASHDLLWNTDKAIRTTMFKNAVNSGMTDAQAAAHTNKFMVNYNNTTPFERKYLKPLIPYYNWKKGNLPLQLSQTLAQTPKYALWNNAKNAISQGLSGQPTDQKGRVNSGQQLSDGSHTMLDFYNPMDDINKIGEKGLLPYLGNSLTPPIKEALNQVLTLSQAAGLPYQSKFPIYNQAEPLNYKLQAAAAHGINAVNPFSGSAIAGLFGNQSNFINKQLGVPVTNPNAPGETPLEAVTKLLGGFTARSNPSKDALNQHYQQNQNKLDLRRFMKVEAKVNANK